MSQISIQAACQAKRQTPKRRESEQGSSAEGKHLLAGCIAAVNKLFCDTPSVDLSRDRTALSGQFPEEELKAGRELGLRNCEGSQIHQTARLGLPQWCTILFFVALQQRLASKCISGFLYGGRTPGVAYPAAPRQGNTYSKCDVAHTDSPTQHTRCMIRTQQRTFHRRARDRMTHRTSFGSDATARRRFSGVWRNMQFGSVGR